MKRLVNNCSCTYEGHESDLHTYGRGILIKDVVPVLLLLYRKMLALGP